MDGNIIQHNKSYKAGATRWKWVKRELFTLFLPKSKNVKKPRLVTTGDFNPSTPPAPLTWRKEVVSTNKSHKLIANKQRYIVCVWFKVEHLASIIINSCSFTASTYNKDVINWKKNVNPTRSLPFTDSLIVATMTSAPITRQWICIRMSAWQTKWLTCKQHKQTLRARIGKLRGKSLFAKEVILRRSLFCFQYSLKMCVIYVKQQSPRDVAMSGTSSTRCGCDLSC